MDYNANMKMRKNKTFYESFKHALEGIRTTFKEERNMRYHVSFSLLAILVACFLQISKIEWMMILFVIFLVLVTETINTAFENLVDLVTNHEYHEIAKKVKDMAAGAVLLSAICAALTGALIFLPKIWHLFV